MKRMVSDSLDLAHLINESTDIVTDLTDVVQEELPKKSLQGSNDEATNTKILNKLDHIDIDTSDLATKEQVQEVYRFMTVDLVEIIEGHSADFDPIPDDYIESLFENEDSSDE